MKRILKNILLRIPSVKRAEEENARFRANSCYPPGHFYSPIVSVNEVKSMEDEIWTNHRTVSIPGINLNTDEQLETIANLAKYYDQLPYKDSQKQTVRYRFENNYFCHTDAVTLYGVIRHFQPKKIVEVGSGFSSAVMLDTNEIFFNNKIHLTFIEPFPDRLVSLLKESDLQSVNLISNGVQSVDLSVFEELEDNDILFVDSSHVVKTGSDVHHILFQILPLLKPGVLIHFHDVMYPFEYPKNWVFGGRNWNEAYFVRAFLQYNSAFKIRLFPSYLHANHSDVFREMPLCYQNTGGSIWLEKQ